MDQVAGSIKWKVKMEGEMKGEMEDGRGMKMPNHLFPARRDKWNGLWEGKGG